MLHTVVIWLPLLAFCVSCAGTAWLAHDLTRAGELDHPIERSSHVEPTPRGGGLAIMAAAIPLLVLIDFNLIVLLALSFLIAVSWLDDRHGLSWQRRLLVHCFAAGITLASLWQGGDLQRLYTPFGDIPLVLFIAIIGIAYVWHLNLFNFMDGSDGLASAQALVISLGVAIYLFVFGADYSTGLQAVVLAAAILGFLVWNYPPARIFMGDVGSIPLGFLTGYLLIKLAASGGWGLALALPLWFWMDATSTLWLRLVRGNRIFSAHRDHFYQKAAGRSKRRHKLVLSLFIILQVFSAVVMALCLAIFSSRQWELPLVSAAFGALFFMGLARLARNAG